MFKIYASIVLIAYVLTGKTVKEIDVPFPDVLGKRPQRLNIIDTFHMLLLEILCNRES